MKLLYAILFFLSIALANYCAGYYMGRDKAFSDIILEKCWLNKVSRDVECITQMID